MGTNGVLVQDKMLHTSKLVVFCYTQINVYKADIYKGFLVRPNEQIVEVFRHLVNCSAIILSAKSMLDNLPILLHQYLLLLLQSSSYIFGENHHGHLTGFFHKREHTVFRQRQTRSPVSVIFNLTSKQRKAYAH